MDEVSYTSVGWTAARLARQVEVALSALDLSPAQYRMLVRIARGTDASSSLAQKLAVSAPSVTAVVDGLVQRGAVERAHSVEDRRRIALALTEPGRTLLASAEKALQARLGAIAGELEDGDLAASALDALALWGEALDRARAKREAARRAEGAEAPP
jgi:DNA-binding MarR family transcriptional regulator